MQCEHFANKQFAKKTLLLLEQFTTKRDEFKGLETACTTMKKILKS